MRVITGTARGTKLETLDGDDVVRPTAEKVKEALFSAIQFHIPGAKVLDLFAGSGQLGIEALSRGANICTFVDMNREATAVVMRNLKTTGLFSQARVTTGDSLRYIAHCKDKFDIILVDPPYKKGIVDGAMEALSSATAEGGFVVCETESSCKLPDWVCELKLKKNYRYGKTVIWIYRNETQLANNEEQE